MTAPDAPPRLVLRRSLSREERTFQLLSPSIAPLGWFLMFLMVTSMIWLGYNDVRILISKGEIIKIWNLFYIFDILLNAFYILTLGYLLFIGFKFIVYYRIDARRAKSLVLTEVVIEGGMAELHNQLGERLSFALHDAEVRMGRNKARGDAWVSFRGKDPRAPSYLLELELELTREAWQQLQLDLKQHLLLAEGP